MKDSKLSRPAPDNNELDWMACGSGRVGAYYAVHVNGLIPGPKHYLSGVLPRREKSMPTSKPSPIKCSKKRVLTDCKVVVSAWPSDLKIEEPHTIERELKAKKLFAWRLEQFFKDHLDLGVHYVRVDEEYEDQCSHCGDTWHEDIDSNGVVRCSSCGNEMEVER